MRFHLSQIPKPPLGESGTILPRTVVLEPAETPSSRPLSRKDHQSSSLTHSVPYPVSPRFASAHFPTSSAVTVTNELVIISPALISFPTTSSPITNPSQSLSTSGTADNASQISSSTPNLTESSPTPSLTLESLTSNLISSPTSSPDLKSTSHNKKATLLGPIIGGVVGSIVLLVIICYTVLLYRRHQRFMEATYPSPFSIVTQTNTLINPGSLQRNDSSKPPKRSKASKFPTISPYPLNIERDTSSSHTTQETSLGDDWPTPSIAKDTNLDYVSSVGASSGSTQERSGDSRDGSRHSIDKPRKGKKMTQRTAQTLQDRKSSKFKDKIKDKIPERKKDRAKDRTQNGIQGGTQDTTLNPSTESTAEEPRNLPPLDLRLRQVVDVMDAMRAEIQMLRGQIQATPARGALPPPPSYILDIS